MRIVTVPCLEDNFAYLVICERTKRAAVVDPSEAAPVLDAVAREGVTLSAIWNTHHHWDHTGGNDDLAAAVADLEVVAHASDSGRVPAVTRLVDEGDEVALGDEVRARVIFNPGHTTGAISYFIAGGAPPAVFTGDTLFGAGCGRLFEGTPEMMHESLSKLAALPEATQVYCGHEYTASNLVFAAAVEPQNECVRVRAGRVRALAPGEHSVPFTIADERATNPFLRAEVPAVVEAANANSDPSGASPAEIFGALRRWKDKFRG